MRISFFPVYPTLERCICFQNASDRDLLDQGEPSAGLSVANFDARSKCDSVLDLSHFEFLPCGYKQP